MFDPKDHPQRMAQGDERALAAFARYYGPRFLSFLVKRGIERSRAEDLAASFVGDIALKTKKFDPKIASFSTWVWHLAINSFRDWLRKERRFAAQRPLADLVANEAIIEPDELEDSEKRLATCDAVSAAMEKLSSLQQQIVSQRYFEDFSFAEIAQRLAIDASRCRVEHHRALKRMRQELSGSQPSET